MAETNWETIIEQHGPLVWRTAYRLLGNREEASDCFQDVFTSAVRVSLSQPVRSWPALLRKLATLKSIDLLRKRLSSPLRTAEAEQLAVAVSHGPDPADEVAGTEMVQCVRQAIARLPQDQAVAVWLRSIDGLSHRQIAQHLGCSVLAVRALAYRGRKNLKLLLQDWDTSRA